ncbi:MAG: HEAT repeat domain-containing protein [Vampirovibrio sp.]|nr:HEAT repeat domain-containing protein [Vampirovibrio sp.]
MILREQQDNPLGEYFSLEDTELYGRKSELRQLVRLLNLSKAGQPKSVLISGESGIGKTELINVFIENCRKNLFCRVLNLNYVSFQSPEKLYVDILEALEQEAHGILDEALIAVNEIIGELGLQWDRQDLTRAISLVKLQESIGSNKDASNQIRLAKAIRSSVPTVKKLKFAAIDESIEKLVNLIINPWLLVASALLSPMTPQLKESLKLVESIREGRLHEHLTLPKQPISLPGMEEVHESSTPVGSEAGDSQQGEPILPFLKSKGHSASGQKTFENSLELLSHHLIETFQFINHQISSLDSGIVLILDNWDELAKLQDESKREELKELLVNVLKALVDQGKNSHLMVVLASRSQGESYSLGGPLYSLFRTKLLLSGLTDTSRSKFFKAPFKKKDIQLSGDVVEAVFALTRGNPFWLWMFQRFLLERSASNNIKNIDFRFYQKLGVEKLQDLLEINFTSLKLEFISEEAALYKFIAALIKRQHLKPFTVAEIMREFTASQGFSDKYVYTVLHALYSRSFLDEAEIQTYNGKKPDPAYVIPGRMILEFLQQKTAMIQPEVSSEEKLEHLKKIIPLSVKSGELDREKTLEVIALSNSTQNGGMLEFLEKTFLESLNDEKPVVRVTALNNLAILDSPASIDAIILAMKDPDSLVREYAARNLFDITAKPMEYTLHNRIVETLMEVVDDEYEAVRVQVYHCLAHYKHSHDLISIFLKGLTDASEGVRLTSIQALAELETDSPLVRNSFVQATHDKSINMRKNALIGLKHYCDEEIIELMTDVLREDEDSSVRTLAADILSNMEDKQALRALVEVLKNESSEDVKLTIIRALGKRQGWHIEEILLQILQNCPPEAQHDSPALLWTCVRSLGNVGGSEDVLNALTALKTNVTNEIIQTAIREAIRHITERQDQIRRYAQHPTALSAQPSLPLSYSDDDDYYAVPEEESEFAEEPEEDVFDDIEMQLQTSI